MRHIFWWIISWTAATHINKHIFSCGSSFPSAMLCLSHLGKLPLDHQQQLLQKKSTTEKINGYFQKTRSILSLENSVIWSNHYISIMFHQQSFPWNSRGLISLTIHHHLGFIKKLMFSVGQDSDFCFFTSTSWLTGATTAATTSVASAASKGGPFWNQVDDGQLGMTWGSMILGHDFPETGNSDVFLQLL